MRLLPSVGCRITDSSVQLLLWTGWDWKMFNTSQHLQLPRLWVQTRFHKSWAESYKFSFSVFFKVLQCLSTTWLSAFPAALCFGVSKDGLAHQSFCFHHYFKKNVSFIFIKAHFLGPRWVWGQWNLYFMMPATLEYQGPAVSGSCVPLLLLLQSCQSSDDLPRLPSAAAIAGNMTFFDFVRGSWRIISHWCPAWFS